ncbi:MAG: hypothetical protein EOL88_03900 [Bacteroidia bacterium]|nr:hypothetical protein [Bacteroidia bacterium]
MKRLLIKILLFVVLGFPVYFCAHRYIYTHYRTPMNELIRRSLKRADSKRPYDRVIVGDSVSRQLFNDKNQAKSKYEHLTTNAATTMLGQYVLLMEYLKHNTVSEIIVLMNPYSMTDDLNRKFTANYVVGTMYRHPYKQYVTQRAERQIRHCRWWFVPVLFSEFPELCLIDYQQVNPKPYVYEVFFSPLSIEYLKLLRDECAKRNILLRLISPPIPAEFKDMDTAFMAQQLVEHGLMVIAPDYFPLKFKPDAMFADELHPKGPYIDEFRNSLGVEWRREGGEIVDRRP